jgi:hypothetical protein
MTQSPRCLLLFAFLLLASSAVADHTHAITSITPSSGRTGGGENVEIRGTGFTPDAAVFFGGTAAFNVQVVDATTIRVKTPPHLPGVSRVSVAQQAHSATAPFTYTGSPSEGFEQLLLPIYLGRVNGAFGSEFHTEFQAWNNSYSTLPIHGLQYLCQILCPILDPVEVPIQLLPDQSFDSDQAFFNGTPGVFLYVPKDHVRDLGFKLRVFDVSRDTADYGTELPVVRARDFTFDQPLSFPRVPAIPGFRITLRIYSPVQNVAFVRFNGEEHMVPLNRDRNDLFTPAYGVFTAFPTTDVPINVSVAPPNAIIHPPPLNIYPPPIWAFISITNNETQQITTMTPH